MLDSNFSKKILISHVFFSCTLRTQDYNVTGYITENLVNDPGNATANWGCFPGACSWEVISDTEGCNGTCGKFARKKILRSRSFC